MSMPRSARTIIEISTSLEAPLPENPGRVERRHAELSGQGSGAPVERLTVTFAGWHEHEVRTLPVESHERSMLPPDGSAVRMLNEFVALVMRSTRAIVGGQPAFQILPTDRHATHVDL
jgi:hypothetical protein